MSSKRVLFYVLHLLGVGHVYRAKRLMEGMVAAGLKVDVIYGGEKIEGLTLPAQTITYLPPIRAADPSFTHYLDGEGNTLGEAWMKRRQSALMAAFDHLSPDIIITEAYPFGRRLVRHEISALLQAAKARPKPPLIAASIRDILEPRKAGRAEETVSVLDEFYDHILVHSDPALMDLAATYPLAQRVTEKTSYTGFVVPPAADSQTAPTETDIIVTVGGGAFGGPLARVALEAASLRRDLSWTLATGPNMHADDRAFLRKARPGNLTLVERLEGLTHHLAKARLSISQCGYNTAMDVLSAHQHGCRAVFVPYDIEGQKEQVQRAALLEKAGYAINLPQSRLTPEALLQAMDRALALPPVDHRIDFDGVGNTTSLITSWLRERHG
ncbi:MAG: glycosyltransferase [Pseudomonadota bacterium]